MGTIGQRTNINLIICLIHLALCCLAQRILIDGDNLPVQENALILSRKLSKVVAQCQYRRHHAPHTHLSLIFRIVAPYSTQIAGWAALAVQSHYQHIHIRPLAVAHILGKRCGDIHDIEDTHSALVNNILPHISYIIAGSPERTAYLLAPLFAVALSPLADAEHDVAARVLQGVGHALVASACRGAVLRRVAIVVFQVVDPPRCERASVLLLEAQAGGPSTAGKLGGVAVDAELQALGVHIVGQCLDAVGKFLGVGNDVVVAVASALPQVVDEDVLVAGLHEAVLHHGVGRFAD